MGGAQVHYINERVACGISPTRSFSDVSDFFIDKGVAEFDTIIDGEPRHVKLYVASGMLAHFESAARLTGDVGRLPDGRSSGP